MNAAIGLGAALALGGIAATWAAWWAVAFRGISIWRVMPWVLAGLGAATLVWADDLTWWGAAQIATGADLGGSPFAAAGTGLATGLILFVATRIAIVPLSRWRRFAIDARRAYARADGRAVASVLVLAFVSAASEELFWRGWVQPDLVAGRPGQLGIALAVSWAVYLVANLPSRSLAIGAGAVVGGGAWALLAAATGGVLAPLCCHAVWTLAMIVAPPRVDRA